MRIATFNVHMWRDREQRPTEEQATELLRSLRCDAIVLQEVPEKGGALQRVSRTLGMHASFAPAEESLGNALLSLSAPCSFEHFRISSGSHARSAFLAELPWQGSTFTLAGTHLDQKHEYLRLQQLGALLDMLGAFVDEGLILLAADLNALTLSDYGRSKLEELRLQRQASGWEDLSDKVVACLQARGFADLWRIARDAALGAPSPAEELPTCWNGTRIDYIWAAPQWTKHARLLDCRHLVTSAASDHCPVIAELAVKDVR